MKKHLLITACLAIALGASSSAHAQETCNALMLQNANRAYEFGRFQDAVDLLDPCLPDGFDSKTEKTDALRLVALAHLALDSEPQARDITRQILRLDSRYRANPAQDPLLFVDMVNDLRPKWYTWMYKGNGWKSWTGRTLLVGAMVSVPLMLQSDPVPDLPLPPALPN